MDFGAYLRQARERRGISLRQISASTKISVAALDALERNDISHLPGGIFTRAFVRSYAAEVGLDAEETVRHFLAQFPVEGVAEGSPYASDSQENEAFESQRQMAGTLLRLVAASLPVALVILYFTMRGGRSAESQPDAAPALGAAPVTESAPPSPEAPPKPATGGPASSPAPASAEPRPQTLTLDLRPRGPCWVSLTLDGQPVFSRLMQPGEREVHEATREIVLNVGDAGALAFSINDRPGRPLGQDGQVVTVRINRENYREFVVQ